MEQLEPIRDTGDDTITYSDQMPVRAAGVQGAASTGAGASRAAASNRRYMDGLPKRALRSIGGGGLSTRQALSRCCTPWTSSLARS